MKNRLPIVCIDLETTGLDVLKCEPIEIAMVHVREEGDLFVAGEQFLHALAAPPLEEWEAGARDLAERSGLLRLVGAHHSLKHMHGNSPVAAAAHASAEEYRSKQRRAIEGLAHSFLDRIGEGPFIACGNNVGGFDLMILRRLMPGLFARFFYRTLDVSALKLAFGRLDWGAVPEKSKPHRALADCLETIRELNCYHAQAIALGSRLAALLQASP